MRIIPIALILFAIPFAADAQSAGWRLFSIPETGANVDVPTAVFNKDAGRPENAYGHRFTTADGRSTLAFESMANETNASPAAFLAKKHPPSQIAYSRVTDRFFVVSSIRNGNIWYDRCNFAGRMINCVLINYPTTEKRQWDSIVTRISHSLSAG